MSCPTVLPATDFSELLGRRVPVVAAPSGDATEVQGVGWDANGEPVWQACLGVQWHSAQTRPCAKRPWVLAQSRSAWQALQAQEAGAAAVVVPADELPTALAVLGIPVVADGLADGRSLVQALDQGRMAAAWLRMPSPWPTCWQKPIACGRCLLPPAPIWPPPSATRLNLNASATRRWWHSLTPCWPRSAPWPAQQCISRN